MTATGNAAAIFRNAVDRWRRSSGPVASVVFKVSTFVMIASHQGIGRQSRVPAIAFVIGEGWLRHSVIAPAPGSVQAAHRTNGRAGALPYWPIALSPGTLPGGSIPVWRAAGCN